MFTEVKREITVISHYNEKEAETISQALHDFREKCNPHLRDMVDNMLAESALIPDKISSLIMIEEVGSRGDRDPRKRS